MEHDDIMEMDAMHAATRAPAGGTLAHILCCLCGTPTLPNPSNTCVPCLQASTSLASSLPNAPLSLCFCKHCDRYLAAPPRGWVVAELESRELLALLLKKLTRHLSSMRLIDAKFLWTEPHSRRIAILLTLQQEVESGAILQQDAKVEFRVETFQCEDCKREAAAMDAWTAVVQVRQKVDHKRTFFYLEQMILKHKAHDGALGIKNVGEGIDFYFLNKSGAMKFLAFVAKCVPVKSAHNKASEHLVTHDAHNNTFRYKYTFLAEIAPLCRDDLVCLPLKVMSANCRGIGPIVLVTKVSGAGFSLVDPNTAKVADFGNSVFWSKGAAGAPAAAQALHCMMSTRRMVEYTVLDIDVDNTSFGKYRLADVTVAKTADLGANDRVYYARTHLGAFLQPGDLAMGYNVSGSNANEDETSQHRDLELPDVVLVKKAYAKSSARQNKRRWKLKALAVEEEAAGSAMADDTAAEREARDRETFLQDLEQDAEMRAQVNIYKDARKMSAPPAATDDGEEYPEVPLDELLDELNISAEPDAS